LLDSLEERSYFIKYKLQRVLVWKKKSRIALDAYAAFLFAPTRTVASYQREKGRR
jgi:hypothetical protein